MGAETSRADRYDLDALARDPDFVAVASRMSGLDPERIVRAEGMDSALRAANASLATEADTQPIVAVWYDHRREFSLDVDYVAHVAARHSRGMGPACGRGWCEGIAGAGFDATHPSVSTLAAHGSRTLVWDAAPDGPVALGLGGLGSGKSILAERRDGRISIGARVRPEGVDIPSFDRERALARFRDYPSLDRMEFGRQPARLARELAVVGYDGTKAAAGRYLDEADAIAARRFVRAVVDLGDVPMLGAAYACRFARGFERWVHIVEVRDTLAGTANPGWFVQAFRSSPTVAAVVAMAATVRGRAAPSMSAPARRCRATVEAIDGGCPPSEALGAFLKDSHGVDLTGAALRSLSVLGFHAVSLASAHLVPAVDAVTKSAPSHRALSPDECLSVGSMVGGLGEGTGAVAVLRAHPSGFAAMARASMENGRYVDAPGGTDDMVAWMSERMFRAGAGRRGAIERTTDLLFPKGRTRRSLREIVDRWHRDVAGLDAEYHSVRFEATARAMAALDMSVLFPRLSGYPVPDGLAVEGIVGEERCVVEGAEMDHCVATYRDRAAAGEVMLFSLRDAEGRSTVSFGVEGRGASMRLSVGQVRSRSNAEAPRGHRRWADDVARWSRGGLPEAFRDAVEASAKCARAVRDMEESLPPADAERLSDAAFGAVRPFLARADRAGDRRDWLRKGKAGETVAA